MKNAPRLLLPIALLAILAAGVTRAGAQAPAPVTPELIATSDRFVPASEIPDPLASPPRRPAPDALPDTSSWAYRLDIWRDLFTPGETAVLRSSSDILTFERAVRRVESSGPIQRGNQEAAGDAFATAVSSSFVYFGDREADPFLDPVVLGQPGVSFERAFERQAVPMASDLAQRSRGGDRYDHLDGISLWVARTVALVPARGSMGSRAGFAAVQIGTVSVLSGTWPDLTRMSAADFARFGRAWIRRTANALLATELGRLTQERPIATVSGRTVDSRREPLPVSLLTYSY